MLGACRNTRLRNAIVILSDAKKLGFECVIANEVKQPFV